MRFLDCRNKLIVVAERNVCARETDHIEFASFALLVVLLDVGDERRKRVLSMPCDTETFLAQRRQQRFLTIRVGIVRSEEKYVEIRERSVLAEIEVRRRIVLIIQ